MFNMPPLICAHRGASGYYPENSLKAFQEASQLKADSVEIDVRQTGDGHLVACHDFNLTRLFGIPRRLSEITLEEFKRAKINNLEPPASLEEIFREIDDNLQIVLDVKENGLEKKILGLINQCKLKERIIVSSFDPRVLAVLRKLDSEIKTALIAGPFSILPLAVNICFYLRQVTEYIKSDYMHLWYSNLLYRGYRTLSRRGYKLSYWTVDDPADMSGALKLNPHSIITNTPDLARKIIDQQSVKPV